MKKILILLFVSFLTTACQQNVEQYHTDTLGVTKNPDTLEMLPHVYDGTIKNVVLLIGDGTGIAQITSGQYAIAGPQGRLHIQTMPVTGIVQTLSSDNLITDSAAGATALSCGNKTYNGQLVYYLMEHRVKLY